MRHHFLRLLLLFAAFLTPFSCDDSRSLDIVDGGIENRNWEDFQLIPVDTLLYIENTGVEHISGDINGHRFELTVDSLQEAPDLNIFLLPLEGEITLNMVACMGAGDNLLRLKIEGPPGSKATVVISNQLLPGRVIDYEIRNSFSLP